MLRTCLLVALVVVIVVVRRSDTAILGNNLMSEIAKAPSLSLGLGSSGSGAGLTTKTNKPSVVGTTKSSSQNNVNPIVAVVSNNFCYK